MVNGSQHQASSARQQQILDAALHCFLEKGIDATTIADVRERSNASTGSIYHHFKDKEGLVGGVYQRIVGRYQTSLQSALPEMNTSKTLIMGLVLHFTEWAAQNKSAVRLLGEMRHSPASHRMNGRADLPRETMLSPALVDLEKAAEDGDIIKMAAPLYEAIILGPVFTVSDYWYDDNPRAAKDAEQLAKSAWQALNVKSANGKDSTKDKKDRRKKGNKKKK